MADLKGFEVVSTKTYYAEIILAILIIYLYKKRF